MTIRLENVSVSLGRRTVVSELDTAFAPGRLTGVIGPNGAGKSTLVRAILALVPFAGAITIDGEDIKALSRASLARTLAYLPQGQILHWPLTVERLVGLGRLPHLAPFSRIADRDLAAIEHAMQRTDILPLRSRIATELSGGERARVMLARTLAVEAPALIVDEPLANLDPGHQIDVMELLRQESRAGATVVAVLHDLTMAARYCDDLLLIDRGRVVAKGAPASVLTSDNIRDVYGVAAQVELDRPWPSISLLGRQHAP